MPRTFADWFEAAFKQPVPEQFATFLAAHPNGLRGDGISIYAPEAIIGETEDRDLEKEGVCLIGKCGNTITDILLRAKDGRVFVVDRTDYKVVDAWFASISSLTGLVEFDD